MRFLLLVSILVMFAGPTLVSADERPQRNANESVQKSPETTERADVLSVVGTGKYIFRKNAARKVFPRQRLMALRGAKSSAYKKMAELIEGLFTSDGKALTDTINDPNVFQSKISVLVRGGSFTRPRYSDEGATVTLELPLASVEKVLGSKLLHARKTSSRN